jgi:hypothetical protein
MATNDDKEVFNVFVKPYGYLKGADHNKVNIKIYSSDFQGVAPKEGVSVFSFEDCHLQKINLSSQVDVPFKEISIAFIYCFIGDIEIGLLMSSNITLYFHGCIIQGNINVAFKNIHLNNCITPSLFLQNQDEIDISYTEENIFPTRWNKLLKRIRNPSLNDFLKTKQSVFIANSKSVRVHSSRHERVNPGIHRDRSNQIDGSNIRYNLSDEQKEMLNLNISIDYSGNIEDVVTKVENCLLNSLSIRGIANGQIFIENNVIENLYIRNFSTKREALFFLISPRKQNSKLEIHTSNLDNAWFDNINFNGYEILSFYRTRFNKASFTSCNFPTDNLSFEKFKTLENIHYPDKKPENYYKDQYETFLQLKKSLENSGNIYEAQKLNAISKESLRRISDLPSWDKAILWINANSNNHNLSIKKPFFGLLVSSILFYVLYLLSINRIFTSTEFDWVLVGQYFSFLDLTHKNDFLIARENFNFCTLLIDFINKICVGFFIYQFVASFRKYGKS